jgi:hypothetical protein
LANRQFHHYWQLTLLLLAAALAPAALGQQTESAGERLIEQIDSQWGIDRYRQTTQSVRGFPLPLGPMEKVRGIWQLKRSQPFTGSLLRTTWQVGGSPVTELFEGLVAELEANHELLYRCSARGCGNASEWASRVYRERLLYGRDEYMRYAAFKTAKGDWLTLFTAARTADRQYLHLDVALPSD